ncbi:bifunctional glutamate N-acetyltransferase/amino-acid acetyltransferase ArgJ [Pelagibacteraceae bacterium]|nr:bifunctional glutamate N-acetyltransferase/amino-acid acetyltransferase ArgJ [Pelagibacteraceae bacterium]MDC3156323.1 bifunctional glutamate N-acetyltransferase/amino-acid acetyltransferase ArgJ [Pelagibacteraceae bacterium]
MISLFKPKKIKDFNPTGLKIYTFNAGFKKKDKDLLLIIFDRTINVSCVYSKTSTPSAPIIWDKKNNKGKAKALVVNAGNANAHTGNDGLKIIDKYVKALTKKIGCRVDEVLVSSTGVIGEKFNPNLIINKFEYIKSKNKHSLLESAKAIMTTDTFPKVSIKNINLDNQSLKIYGIAKGSGMIQPNMGTMLVYIFIECEVSKKLINRLLKNNLDNTFNSITVDSDTSTSDTLMMFSIGNKNVNLNKKNFKILNNKIHELMHDLSLQVIKDGEGVSKLIRVNVINARSKNQAKKIAFSIANSPLVKTAVAGEDANWGRVIMAIGKTEENIYQNKIKVYFGKNIVCEKGSISKKINIIKLNKYMKNNIIEINVKLDLGKFSQTVYGNDLTFEYLKINADYRS